MALKILITNDDGIASAQLRSVTEWASRFAEVSVFAPATEQSGKSQGIDLNNPIEVIKQDGYCDGAEAYSVSSTPADCVRIAVLAMGRKPDLIISGINNGYNVGYDILYSGTVGAIFEASLLGFPAIALSAHYGSDPVPHEVLDRVKAYFDEKKLLEHHGLYNVNIPDEPKGIRITRQGGAFYSDDFEICGEGKYIARGIKIYQPGLAPDLDTDYVSEGYITVTPLSIDRTEYGIFEKLK